jgi:hypothetical protein
MKEDRKDEKKGRGAKGRDRRDGVGRIGRKCQDLVIHKPLIVAYIGSIEIVGSHDLGQPHFTASSNSISQLQSIHAAGRLPLTDLVSSPP